MSQSNEFTARVLRNGSRTFAAYASAELVETHVEATRGLVPDPFAYWQDCLAVRIEELAAALAAEQPKLFTSQVIWAKTVLAARGVAVEYLRAGLTILKEVFAKELTEAGQDSANEYLDAAIEAFDGRAADATPHFTPDTGHGRLAANYLLALLEGDRRRASRTILDAIDQPDAVRELYLRVLLPAQAEVGRMWLCGEINVAEEHFASHTTKLVMAQLLSQATFQPPNGKTVLTAAVAGNRHDIGLSAVADFFEMAGWRTIQLGADVPNDDLAQAVEFFEVDLLALSASLSVQIETFKSTVQAVRSGRQGGPMKILAGGLAFAGSSSLAVELGADAYATDPEDAVRAGRQLVFG